MTTQTITLEVNVDYDAEGRRVLLTNPNLGGELWFSYTSVGLAEVQLDALNLNRNKTSLEKILDDSEELTLSIKNLKDVFTNKGT